MTTAKMTLAHCCGCEDDFYNGNNEMGVKQCWMFPKARVMERFWTGTLDTPTTCGAFRLSVIPSCFHAKGEHYRDQLPDFVKASDVTDLTDGTGKESKRLVRMAKVEAQKPARPGEAATLEDFPF